MDFPQKGQKEIYIFYTDCTAYQNYGYFCNDYSPQRREAARRLQKVDEERKKN